jgi:hypothetical protein
MMPTTQDQKKLIRDLIVALACCVIDVGRAISGGLDQREAAIDSANMLTDCFIAFMDAKEE